jgi:uncharacterized membrane protein
VANAYAQRRLDSIDLLRGIVMAIMVLDHTRDFVHGPALYFDPTDLARTSPAIFMTRWITHFCAPVFVFLAGLSAYLQRMRGKSVGQLSRFLLSRAVWLFVMELAVLHLLVWFNLDFSLIGPLQVIWALGWSMIALAGLIYLPTPAIAAIGVSIVVLHNLFDNVHVTAWTGPQSPVPSLLAKGWMMLHQPGLFPLGAAPSPVVWVIYPLIPWVGVMAAGYAFGAIYEREGERRIVLLRRTGLLLIAAFVVIRGINVYGDPSRWSRQPSVLWTVLSFMNTTKYPASLLYVLMTLGPALLALSWFEASRVGAWSRPLVILGRVPLFFYLLQWPLAHASGIVANLIAGRPYEYMFLMPPALFNVSPGQGFRLWVVYVCWICIILIAYPPCRWFAGVKQRRRDVWLSYL